MLKDLFEEYIEYVKKEQEAEAMFLKVKGQRLQLGDKLREALSKSEYTKNFIHGTNRVIIGDTLLLIDYDEDDNKVYAITPQEVIKLDL